MKAFEIRLAVQHANNVKHIRNLSAFIDDKRRFSALCIEQQALMLEQLEVQKRLDSILVKRLTLLNIPI